MEPLDEPVDDPLDEPVEDPLDEPLDEPLNAPLLDPESFEFCAPPSSLLDDPPRHAGSARNPRAIVETPAFNIRLFTSHLVSGSRMGPAGRLTI